MVRGRVEKAEERVYGSVVEALVLAEIRAAEVHGRNRDTAAYGNEEQECEHAEDGGSNCAPAATRKNRKAYNFDSEEADCEDDSRQHEPEKYAVESQRCRQTPEYGTRRSGEIEKRRHVEAETPESIEHHVEVEDGAEHQRQNNIPHRLGTPEPPPMREHRGYDAQRGYHRKIAGHGAVHGKAVAKHTPQVSKTDMAVKLGVEMHKHHPGGHKNSHHDSENGEEFEYISLHYLYARKMRHKDRKKATKRPINYCEILVNPYRP